MENASGKLQACHFHQSALCPYVDVHRGRGVRGGYKTGPTPQKNIKNFLIKMS